MDAFEPIRDKALEFHRKLVAQGSDPLNPPALVQAAIQALDIEFARLPVGDPALKGARALYDGQSGTICCEKTDDTVAEALLIAHELGHACLHADSPPCAADDIDPSRSVEAAPVGLQRVEDYGARERRELQANVFARELLFPRPLARQLHVDQLMTAAAISQRTGLPKNLVRQQLFDVLLLPSQPKSSATSAPSPSPNRPDPSQDRAAAHRGSPFQLQAGPGTGKTRTLVKRVLSLLAEGIDPSTILILTFSNRAAGELSERITAAVPDRAARIWIGTFHAFGLDLVRRYHDRLGLSPNPPLFDRSDAIEVLEEILPTLPLVHYRDLWDPARVLRDIVTAISRAKDEVATAAHYRILAENMRQECRDNETREAAEKCLEIAQIYDLYEKALADHHAVDFGDLIMRPTLLLEQEPAIRIAIQLRHRHVLVDEYQDINRASGRLLKAVVDDGKRLWVVGDSRQSIYRFRGASSANMAAFPRDYPGAASDQLTVNYRSTEQIVGAFTAVAPQMGSSAGMLTLTLTADRGSGPGRTEIRQYETLEDEIGGLAASIRSLESQGVRLRDQAVLCRRNVRLNEVAAGMEARGIAVLHLGSLFERSEVRDLLALMSLLIDPFGDSIVRVGAMPRYDLTLQDTYAASKQLRASRDSQSNRWSELLKTPGVSADGIAGLKRLADDLAEFPRSVPAWEFLATYLLDRTDLGRQMSNAESVTDRMRAVAVWQFLNFTRDQGPAGKGLPIQRTLDRVRQLVLLAEERDLRQVPAAALDMDAVRLMTVHGSKGLEFEAVHLPGLTTSSFPIDYRGQRCPPPIGMIEGVGELSVTEEAKQAHRLEEECLFFVGLSRARTFLRIYLAQKQANGNNRSPSRFLDWIPHQWRSEIAQADIMRLPEGALRETAVDLTLTPTWQLTNGQLQLYQKCPRRFFYTHVLGLGGARKMTAFSKTHDCIYELIRWLSRARLTTEPTLESAQHAFDEIWKRHGPSDHAFAADYRRLASRLVTALIQAGAGRRFREAQPLAIDFASGRVLVEPDEIADLPDGTVVVRRVRTGYKRSDEYDKLDYTLYHLAGEAHFGSSFRVEALHLTDETAEEVTITSKKLANRRTKSDSMVTAISNGQFPVELDAVVCPRCPHFFLCPAVPAGPLTLT